MKINQMLPKILLVLLTILPFQGLFAQLEFPEDKVSWNFTLQQDGENATVIGDIKMVEHWHVYAANLPEGVFILPTVIELEKSPNYKTVGKIIEPKPIFEHDEMADEDLYYHADKIKMKQKIKVLSKEDFVLKGKFTFQTCDDTHCLPPHTADFTLKVKGVGSDEEEGSEEMSFASENGDFATDKDGNDFVKFQDNWVQVPEGNSAKFYKKYLELGGNDEK